MAHQWSQQPLSIAPTNGAMLHWVGASPNAPIVVVCISIDLSFLSINGTRRIEGGQGPQNAEEHA